MNIFSYLHKLTPKEESYLEFQDNYRLPSGYITDGEGGIYKIPKIGKLPLYSINKDRRYKFTYNWGTKEIEIYVYIGPGIDTNSYEYVTSYSISAENFIDNPEYWYSVALDEMQNEITNFDEYVREAIEVYGEIIDDDKDNYEYVTKIDYEIYTIDDEGIDDYDTVFEFVTSTLIDYKVKSTLYGEKVETEAVRNSIWDNIELHTKFSMPMTKEELLEIYDNYIDYMKSKLDNDKYTVNFSIYDMFEI